MLIAVLFTTDKCGIIKPPSSNKWIKNVVYIYIYATEKWFHYEKPFVAKKDLPGGHQF